MDNNPRAQVRITSPPVSGRNPSRPSRNRDSRSWNIPDARIPETTPDEQTRLLFDESDLQTPRPSISHDRSIHHQQPRPSIRNNERSVSFEHSTEHPRQRSPPGLRYRASIYSGKSPSPDRSRRQTIRPRRSLAMFTNTGRDADAVSHDFSLAGPAPIDVITANQPYVDPGYTQLNPAYEQPPNVRPVWSLAKPLPRVIRPGMVPTKSEIKKEILQKVHHDEPDSDLESGRIEPTIRFDKISPQLDMVRQEREIQLFEAYKNGSPSLTPRVRAMSELTGLVSPFAGEAIPEETESEQNQSVSHLTEALAQIDEVKANGVPYEDAVPLQAYEASLDEVHNLHTYWSVIRLHFREPLAELLAITVQLTLGFSANLAVTVSKGKAGVGDTSDWAWGLATMVAIYIAGGISGAHLNPAMTLMLYIYRGFPSSKIPIYVAAQMFGAFLATLIAFSIFYPGIYALGEPDLALSNTAANFITFPRADWVSNSHAFATEFVGTAILAISVLALGDDANAPPGAGMNAFIIGLVIVILSISFGWNTGLAMNPARDFGPRLALMVLGYGDLVSDGYWFRVAWLGPITGALTGAFLYDAAIFVGGESPVNYPPKRMKRAARKWRKRWAGRFKRTPKKVKESKDDVAYGTA